MQKQRYSSSAQMCEDVVRRQSNSTTLDKTQHGGEGENKPSSFAHRTCIHWIRYPLKICKCKATSSTISVGKTVLTSMSNASSAFIPLLKGIVPKNNISSALYSHDTSNFHMVVYLQLDRFSSPKNCCSLSFLFRSHC